MTPPRPAPITAAAILLLFFGSECFLLALGVGILTVTAVPPGIPAVSGVGTAAFAAGIGGLFLQAGVKVLRGTLEAPARAGEFVTVVAFLTTVCALSATWVVVIAVRGVASPPLEKVLQLIAAAVGIWANGAALYTAAWLLRRHSPRYHLWAEARRRPPDDREDAA